MSQPPLRAQDFTVGWICPLSIESAAAEQVLDERYNDSPEWRHSPFVLGRMGCHNVVIGSLRAGSKGIGPAAAAATRMEGVFKHIEILFMVGIGGGVPSAEADVRLGDVVVSTPQNGHGGVVQYDLGKAGVNGQFQRTGFLNAPPTILLDAVATLQKHTHIENNKIWEHLRAFDTLQHFDRARAGPDNLFEAESEHDYGANTCKHCNRDKIIHREPRDNSEPIVHFGTIASGNKVIKDGITRDRKSGNYGGVLCFEMEAAGLMNEFPCLVIRGICDYADSHKNKDWQPYAAATAAACTKKILSFIPSASSRNSKIRSSQELRAVVPHTTHTSSVYQSNILSDVEARVLPSPQVEEHPPTLIQCKSIGKGKSQVAMRFVPQIWKRIPLIYQWTICIVAMLGLAAIIISCVLFITKNTKISNQDTILPQVLSSANLDGHTFFLAKGQDGHLLFTTRERGSWTLKWNNTGQRMRSQPTSVVWGDPKRLSVFYVGDDNMVMTGALRDGTWGYWEALGAKVSSPAVICYEALHDAVHIWAREATTAKLIRHNYWEPDLGGWHTLSSDWESGINKGVAKGSRSIPAVVCRNSTITNDVVIYDKDFSLPLHKQWNSTSHRWGPWQALNGSYAGDPVLVSPTDDRIHFFGISKSSKSLIHISWNVSSGYASLYDLKGEWKSVPSVTVTASGRLDVFVLSKDWIVNHRALLGSTWSSSWSDLGISATSAPLATRLDTESPQIILQVIGTDGVALISEWKATSNGGLENVVPATRIDGKLSDDWMVMA